MPYKSAFVFLVLLIVGWSALTGAAVADRPTLFEPGAGLSLYLSLPASPLLLAPRATSVPVGVPLPNSTLPHAEPRCSAINPAAGTVRCSVLPTGRCSLNCNQNAICTAFREIAGPGRALCSTHDGNLQRRCSVLPPPLPGIGDPTCTTFFPVVFGGCSVFATTGTCSVENVPGGADAGSCSIGPTFCSVANFGSAERGFCSVGRPGTKTCSNFSRDPAMGLCSIAANARGACTVFKQAPPGLCSSGGFMEPCSVENGPGPNANGVCRVP